MPIEKFLIPLVGAFLGFTNLETEKNFDLESYLGVWYEYTKFPNQFERNQTNIKAEYFFESENLKVRNTSLLKDGTINSIVGDIFLTDNPSKLNVQFFAPFKADYWILKVGDNYDYAIVSNPQKTFLWVLVRDLKYFDENECEYYNVIEFLKSYDFDVKNLEKTTHL
jgi:apolipoprotein D and lipocalin family protein